MAIVLIRNDNAKKYKMQQQKNILENKTELSGDRTPCSQPVLQMILVSFARSKKIASSGNRTRAARVAGEHSTTEPTMLTRRLDF